MAASPVSVVVSASESWGNGASQRSVVVNGQYDISFSHACHGVAALKKGWICIFEEWLH